MLATVVVAALAAAHGPAHAADAAGASATPPAPPPAWQLSDLYSTPDAWSKAYGDTESAVRALGRYRGTLSQGSSALYAALDAISNARRQAARLAIYASLKSDEDVGIAVNQERRQQSQRLETEIDENTSWLAPEVLRLGRDTVQRFIAQNAQLAKRFDFFLSNILRAAPHTLGDEAEGVLAASGTLLQQPQTVRVMLADSELPLPTITLSGGEQVHLSSSNYEKYREAPNRADRGKQAFDAFWDAWSKGSGDLRRDAH